MCYNIQTQNFSLTKHTRREAEVSDPLVGGSCSKRKFITRMAGALRHADFKNGLICVPEYLHLKIVKKE